MFRSVVAMRMRAAVAMIMVLIMTNAGAADMMMMPLLRRAGLDLVAEDPGAVFAELAIHGRVAAVELGDAVEKRIDHRLVVAQVERLDEFDLRKPRRDGVGLLVDALHQHTGEQKIREHDDPAEAEPGCALKRRVHPRVRHSAEC